MGLLIPFVTLGLLLILVFVGVLIGSIYGSMLMEQWFKDTAFYAWCLRTRERLVGMLRKRR